MQILRLHHIAIICTNYQVSKHFYVEVLGLKVLREVYRESRDSYKLDLALGDIYLIELFSFPNPPLRLTRPEACGLRHLAFAVADLAASKQELEGLGVSVEAIRIDDATGRRFAFFRDPDDLPIEIYED